MPLEAELTMEEAADLLNVSQPCLMRLLDEGRIPSEKVGAHRRIRLADVLAFRERDDEARKIVLDALSADAQDLGNY